jgi:hypothetical protein
MAERIFKYPRTPHLTGSRLQPGDEDLRCIAAEAVWGRALIVEEKVDGANSAISFEADGTLLLQSRGHYLDGGPRERHFALFKSWATCHQAEFWQVLGARWVMYGEWMYAKHTLFYDDLPHYFLEFDVLDKDTGRFLATAKRRALLRELPVVAAPVLHAGALRSATQLQALVRASRFQTPDWRAALQAVCQERKLDFTRALAETDAAGLLEGFYFKIEDDEHVLERFKYVRASYTQTVADSGSHWLERPLIPNRLRAGVDIFAKRL